MPNYFPFDLSFTLLLQQINLPGFDGVMKAISFLGEPKIGAVLIILISAAFYFWVSKRSGIIIAVSTFGAIIIGEIIKILIRRPRPDPILIHQYLPELKPDSFPSGHVLFFIGLFGSLMFLTHNKKLKSLLVLPIILMGISRIYLGEHWLSDVLGSVVLGGVWLFVVARRFRVWNH